MDAETQEPRILQLEGRGVVHKTFGGGGVDVRLPPRERAHRSLMSIDPPKCIEGAGEDGVCHTVDCDHATGLIEQLRALFGGGNGH